MKLMTLLRSIAFFLILFAASMAVAQEAAEVQTALKQWVLTEQIISRERANWTAEKETLTELNNLRQRETAQLAEFTKAAASRIEEVDAQRKKFSDEEADLKFWRRSLAAKVASLENEIRPLISLFPVPLRAKVEEAVVRLENPDPNRPLQHRSRDVLLVTQAYLNFKNAITLDADIRNIDGEDREVEVLYLGVTQAWYVDRSGNYSGYGVPTAKGWVWTEESGLASSVANAIAVQSRRATPAFVKLPLLNATKEVEK